MPKGKEYQFQVDTDVPVWPRTGGAGGRSRLSDAIMALEISKPDETGKIVGPSIYVEEISVHTLSSRVQGLAKKSGMKFTVREDKPGVRVWRID